MLLVEKAFVWSEITSPVAVLLAKDEPTQGDVDTFKKLFVVEYPPHPDGPNYPAFGKEIDSFFQSPSKSMFQYYTCAGQLVHRFGRDEHLAKCSPRQAALVTIVIEAFVHGIWDRNLRNEALNALATGHPSFVEAYELVSRASKKMETQQFH